MPTTSREVVVLEYLFFISCLITVCYVTLLAFYFYFIFRFNIYLFSRCYPEKVIARVLINTIIHYRSCFDIYRFSADRTLVRMAQCTVR